MVNALAPEIQADANAYHLLPAVNSLRYAGFSKAISFYERLPQAIELLFVPAWRIGGGSAAKLVHFAFLCASCPLIVRLAQKLKLPAFVRPDRGSSVFCTPIVAVAGTSAFNDAALVYFSLAAVLLALEDEPLFAGLLAGFCYAVKMTGLVAVPAALALFLCRRQWRSAAICGTAAALVLSPWLIRNWIQTGNPLAPFYNAWFPNPYFYLSTEQALTVSLRDYGVSLWRRFPELLAGSRLQGVIGPAFVLSPLAILAARRKSGILLIALAATIFAALVDECRRSLYHACDSFCFACAVLGCSRPSCTGDVVLHAVTSWPAVVTMYSPQVLHLRDFPLTAALRLESEQHYLNRTSLEYRMVKIAEGHTPSNARIFDLTGAHVAYANREFVGFWDSALGARLLEGLEFARPKRGRFLPQLWPISNRNRSAAFELCGLRARFDPGA